MITEKFQSDPDGTPLTDPDGTTLTLTGLKMSLTLSCRLVTDCEARVAEMMALLSSGSGSSSVLSSSSSSSSDCREDRKSPALR